MCIVWVGWATIDTLWHQILNRLRLVLIIEIEAEILHTASNCGHLYRSRSPGSSEVKKWYQNGIGTPKNLRFNTSKNLFHWFDIWPFLEVIIEGKSKWRSDTCDYIRVWPYFLSSWRPMTTIRGCMPNFSLLS